MNMNRMYDQRLLFFHCLFTCIYFPAILLLLKFTESIYNVESSEFTLILTVLVFAEVLKLLFSMKLSQHSELGKMNSRQNARLKNILLKSFEEFVKFLVAVLLLFVTYYIMAVLFGAPIFSHYKETMTLSFTMSILTFIPACLHLGMDTAFSVLIMSHQQGIGPIGQAVRLNIKATLLGAWVGAIVIPLDWDRPWQVWPVPCVLGAFLGFVLGNLITLIKIVPLLRHGKKSHR